MNAGVSLHAAEWAEAAGRLPAAHPAYPRAAFLVAPDALDWSQDSASDNRYMAGASAIDTDRAHRQHRRLVQLLSSELPVVCFPGKQGQYDGVFPNNVFATARPDGQPTLVVGNMRHPHRRQESARCDIRGWFENVLGYRLVDLQERGGISELTGTMVLDRSRLIGVGGLGNRCDLLGLQQTAAAFGLHACLGVPLAPGEYHANVVLAILGGRVAVVCADGWQQASQLTAALRQVYGADAVIELDAAERCAFAGNCIALRDGSVWMSERAADGLSSRSRTQLEARGFGLRSTPLDEIEKAGGSLRCCVAEIF